MGERSQVKNCRQKRRRNLIGEGLPQKFNAGTDFEGNGDEGG